jgi:hypothetical protein
MRETSSAICFCLEVSDPILGGREVYLNLGLELELTSSADGLRGIMAISMHTYHASNTSASFLHPNPFHAPQPHRTGKDLGLNLVLVACRFCILHITRRHLESIWLSIWSKFLGDSSISLKAKKMADIYLDAVIR